MIELLAIFIEISSGGGGGGRGYFSRREQSVRCGALCEGRLTRHVTLEMAT